MLEKNTYLLLEKNTESNHDTGAATLPPLAACDALGTNLQQVVEVEGGGDRTQEAELAVGAGESERLHAGGRRSSTQRANLALVRRRRGCCPPVQPAARRASPEFLHDAGRKPLSRSLSLLPSHVPSLNLSLLPFFSKQLPLPSMEPRRLRHEPIHPRPPVVLPSPNIFYIF